MLIKSCVNYHFSLKKETLKKYVNTFLACQQSKVTIKLNFYYGAVIWKNAVETAKLPCRQLLHSVAICRRLILGKFKAWSTCCPLNLYPYLGTPVAWLSDGKWILFRVTNFHVQLALRASGQKSKVTALPYILWTLLIYDLPAHLLKYREK
jgi:hypothetical protein